MAIGDGKAKKEAAEIKEELGFILDAVSSIGDKLISSFEDAVDAASGLTNQAEIVSNTFKRGLVSDIKQSVKNTEDLITAQVKAKKGLLKQSEIQKLQNKLEETRVKFQVRQEIAKRNGISLDEASTKQFKDQIELQEEALKSIGKQQKEAAKSKSIFELAGDSIKEFANEIDKSGTLADLLAGNFQDVFTLARASQLTLLAIGAALLQGSKNIAAIAKETGITAEAAKDLQKEFNNIAIASGKTSITGTKLNKSFIALTKQTGLIADFGGQTLQTFTLLNTKLGMSEEAAASLATLARLQGKETDSIVEDTIQTANALIKQNGVAINVKAVLGDVADTSNAIKLSLGGSTEELSAAATQAALLGTNLAGVDAIADSLLNFEDSIRKELEFQVISGKQINLQKARELALNNDLEGLAKEIGDQEAINNAFISGNRIEQEAAAAAIGLSREALGDMVMKSQLNALSAEEFKNTFSEATFEQMQMLGAQEKMQEAFTKLGDSVSQIGLAFAPVLNQVAKFVGFLFSAQEVLVVLGGILAGLAARQAILATLSLQKAIADIVGANAKFGPVGIISGLAGAAAMIALYKGASSVDDAIIPPGGNRILAGPQGAISFNPADTIVAGTNLGGNSNGNGMEKTNKLLSQILNKEGTVKMNATNVGTAFSVNSRQIQ